jgi:DMSO/TMAO reductase YedYZ molybdopterin-dependent catalytic subunit
MVDQSGSGLSGGILLAPLSVLPDASLNAECPTYLLDTAITPLAHFFVRNNGGLPSIEASELKTWTIAIDGKVDKPQRFRLPELRERFETVSVTAVLECAGNGRSAFEPKTDGLQWSRGAVACLEWTGVRLADVLRHCGVSPDAIYTGHHSRDKAPNGSEPALSRGLPLAKALAEETLLAFEVNGEPLGLLHGGPLRVVAPGFPGSAWQKWVERIELRDRVHDGAKMNGTDYRLPSRPILPGEPVGEATFLVIEAMPINSVITFPADGSVHEAGTNVEVRGFAWCGDHSVAGVSISIDGGRMWQSAELEPEAHRFAWRRFRKWIPLHQQETEIIARATDSSGQVQPLGTAAWNPRGYCNNGTHKVRLRTG